MKHLLFAALVFIACDGQAQEPSHLSQVCVKESSDPQLSVDSCKLGLRVLQGLYVAQDRGRFPIQVELQRLEFALRAGKVQIQDRTEFIQMSQEKKADFLYKQMMKESGQPLPVLNRPDLPRLLEKGGVPMSTGTRGGGFDLESETSLSEEIWY